MEHEGIGDQYQRLTKYVRGSMPRHGLEWSAQPSPRKAYEKSVETIVLPAPAPVEPDTLWAAIRARRSIRSYRREPLTLKEVSQLLWATQGTTERVGAYRLRSAPSAGALYPIETYLVVSRVDGLEPGLYHYDPFDAVLQLLEKGERGAQAAAAALDQPIAGDAAAVFVWTAVIERSKWKYRERAYRYIYLDAGHIGQNLYLAATALGLGCCTIGAFYDEEVNRLVAVDGDRETAVYMGCVGRL